MSHHGERPFPIPLDDERKRALWEHLLSSVGPTGRFPEGKMNRHDEGEIALAIGVQDGKVVLNFGKPTAWVGFNPDQAQELGMLLIRRAGEARGRPVTIRIGDEEEPG
jgi:hypothetical protein